MLILLKTIYCVTKLARKTCKFSKVNSKAQHSSNNEKGMQPLPTDNTTELQSSKFQNQTTPQARIPVNNIRIA